MDIIQAIDDPNLFGSLFRDPKTWATWRVFLRALFALPMTPDELGVFTKHTGRATAPGQPAAEAWVIAGRRSGKSFMSALIACYMALFRDWTPYLGTGEQGFVMVIAGDRRQAKVVLNYVKGILAQKIFHSKVTKELDEEIHLGRVVISVKTADFRTLRGFTALCVIADELAYWRSGDGSANPAEEIMHALKPALATVPQTLLLGISSPYNRTGPLYDAYRSKYGQESEESLVWVAPTKAMNPTIKDSVIDRALKEDYSAARAEWLAEFREDLETFLTSETVENAVVAGRGELPPLANIQYLGFTDPSGGKSDSFTLAVSHIEPSGRIVLDCLKEHRPPFAPMDVVKEYADILRTYGIYRVSGDRYAGEWVSRAFQDQGIQYMPSELSKSEIYLSFEPAMNQGRVELLDIKRLAAQLRALERRTRTGGRDSVDHMPGGQDDVANAAAGALVLAAGSQGVDNWKIQWIDMNTGAISGGEDKAPPEYRPLNDEAFVIKYLAYIRRYEMIDAAAKKLGMDPALIKRWVQDNGRMLGSVMSYRAEEIRAIYEGLA
jgi:hypothetical protein